MRKYLRHIFFSFLAFGLALSSFRSKAQQLKLGNNPTQINKAAVLELQSWNQGLRLTRVDTNAVNDIINSLPSAAEKDSTNGMIVFQVSDSSIYYRTGGYWRKLVMADSAGIISLNEDTVKHQTLELVTGTADYSSPRLIDSTLGRHFLFLPYASTSRIGIVSTGHQSWTGVKVFNDSVGIVSLHEGSIPFISKSDDHTLSEDNDNFYWDNENKRLGIGTNKPGNTLEINSGKTDSSGLTFSKMNASSPISTSTTGLIGVDGSGNVVRAGVQRTFNYPIRNLNTPYQISTTQDAFVNYYLTVTVTGGILSLGAIPNASATLEISPNNSWPGTVLSKVGLSNSNLLSVGASLSSTQILSGWIPKGYWVRVVRSPSETGTFNGQEVIMQ